MTKRPPYRHPPEHRLKHARQCTLSGGNTAKLPTSVTENDNPIGAQISGSTRGPRPPDKNEIAAGDWPSLVTSLW